MGHICPIAFSSNFPKTRSLEGYLKKMKFFYTPVSPNFCTRRSVMIISNLSESLAKPLVMTKLNMAYLSSLKNRAKLLLSSLPVLHPVPQTTAKQQNCCCHHLGYSVPPAHHRTIWLKTLDVIGSNRRETQFNNFLIFPLFPNCNFAGYIKA